MKRRQAPRVWRSDPEKIILLRSGEELSIRDDLSAKLSRDVRKRGEIIKEKQPNYHWFNCSLKRNTLIIKKKEKTSVHFINSCEFKTFTLFLVAVVLI